MPATTDLHHQIRQFFDDFVVAFATFDGFLVAQRYAEPCISLDAQGALRSFHSGQEIAGYFQSVLTTYHGEGCRSCRYRDLEVVSMGALSVLATVSWELLRSDGSVVSGWRESYNLLHSDQGWRVFASTDHAG
ncbi:hypothetical protein LJR118_004266 [Acidovorax sp. LjRoot118]|uniref:hypothetical protein n=1 Tax=unclassified Acidovorax TaxID=2684926 RepID=UPI00070B13BF|nr:hypothetical protein [Acidovorax sp. Root217]KRC24750.1 hypothetical protein ASE31_19940 [Acidovorax sp. Root217]